MPPTEHDAYLRKPLPVKAQQWNGERPAAYRLVAWVLDNGGDASVTIIGGEVTITIGENTLLKGYYVYKDADDRFYVKQASYFEKYFEPQPQVTPDRPFLDHGSRA